MIEGSWVALVTPFLADGQIDYLSLITLVDWHVKSGTSGLVILGTTGESPCIYEHERVHMMTEVVKQSQIPVWAGVGTHCTEQTVRFAQEAEACGVQGIMVVTPYYNKPTATGLLAHFHAVHDAVSLPMMVYNVPARTGLDLSIDVIQALSALPRVVALKDATGDIHRLEDYTLIPDLALLSGDDDTAGDFMVQGGHGLVSVTANVVPDLCAKMAACARAGRAEEALLLQKQIEPLNQFLFLESNPIPVKWMLAEMGKIQPALRLPLTPLSFSYHDEGRALLNRDSYRMNPLLDRSE